MIKNDKRYSLSVVMSVFNGANYLSGAIESILHQTYENFEFIIINDGSKDASLNIINDYSAKDYRIKVINQKNKGLPAALNLAIKEANGELIARMDADDISMPDRFERQITEINKYDLALVGTGVYTMNRLGEIDGKRLFPMWHDEIKATLPMRNCICHPSVIFRRDLFWKAGGYDINYKNSQDYELWLRLIENGKFLNINEPLLKYRRHDHRISAKSNRAKQTKYSICAALNYFNRRIGCPDLFPGATSTEISNNVKKLLSSIDDRYSKDCIVRHATRYARNCMTDKDSRDELRKAVIKDFTLVQRLKWDFYNLIG